LSSSQWTANTLDLVKSAYLFRLILGLHLATHSLQFMKGMLRILEEEVNGKDGTRGGNPNSLEIDEASEHF